MTSRSDVAADAIQGIAIGGKCVGVRKRTISPRPDPLTGVVKDAFDKYEVVIEVEGQTYEIGYRDERSARAAAGGRDSESGYVLVAVGSARGGGGARVYWNGEDGGAAGGGGEWLELV